MAVSGIVRGNRDIDRLHVVVIVTIDTFVHPLAFIVPQELDITQSSLVQNTKVPYDMIFPLNAMLYTLVRLVMNKKHVELFYDLTCESIFLFLISEINMRISTSV